MHRPQPPRRPTASPTGVSDLSASCHVLSAQHTAFVVGARLHARWPQTSFRVQVCDQTVTAGPPRGQQHRLEGLNIEWSDGPCRAEVDEAVGFFRGVEPDDAGGVDDHLRRRESLLATPTGHVVLVHYRVGYVLLRRRLSASYRRHLRPLAAGLRDHGRQLVLEQERLRASTAQAAAEEAAHSAAQDADQGLDHPSGPGARAPHRSPVRELEGAQLTAAEARLLDLPEATWTPWGIHHGTDADLMELLACHISPEAAKALGGVPVSLQVCLLLLL